MRGRPGAPTGRPRGWFVTEQPDFRPRGVWLLLAFGAMAIILTVRLADVQIRQGPRLAAMAADQHAEEITLQAHRGRILDRNGRLLASDTPVYSVFADPGVIAPDQRAQVAAQLAPILGLGPSRIEDLLNTSGRFVYLAHKVGDDIKNKLAALAIYGVGTIPEEERIYQPSPVPGESFAANLLGYVNHDGSGTYGIEAYYDKLLRGTNGVESTLRDLAGNPIVLSNQQRKDAQDGHDLRLGLDSTLQYYAEQAIAQQTIESQSQAGEVMIMDTKTGSIRAWAQYPSFDANHFSTGDVGDFRDRSISDLYEPGSVMKVVTFAGGLQHHAITPDYTFVEGNTAVDGFVIHDWDNRQHGKVTMQWVLDDSLNNGAIKVEQLEGQDAYYQNLLRFGIGSPTGIDLAGEQNQPLRPQSQWSAVDYATASFGQQVQVTPVEMMAAINAVANGGVWVQPHAVDAIIDPATGQETAVTPTTRQIIDPATAKTLAHMMTGVVEDRGASGFLAKIPAFKGQIAGKTGTASVAINGRYGQDVITSFTGFMPADQPQYTAFVILRMPHHCDYQWMGKTVPAECEGAYEAAPVFKQMSQVAIDTWKITP